MIIEVDEYKKKISGYDPNNSEDFHIESAKLADKDFYLYLKDEKIKEVIFTVHAKLRTRDIIVGLSADLGLQTTGGAIVERGAVGRSVEAHSRCELIQGLDQRFF